MRLFGQLADWWDARRRETETILDDWMRDAARTNSDFALVGAAFVSTAVHTSMALGGGFVDVLRLGQGVSRGTVGGVAQDGLRLLSLVGPAGRALRLSSRVLTRLVGAMTETAATSELGVCGWIAAVNALRRTGTRHFATLEQLLERAGITLETAAEGIRSLTRLLQPLRALGANPVVARGVTSLEALATFLRAQGGRGVAIIGVGWANPSTRQSAGHVLVAFLRGGRVHILDRTGRVVQSLQELEPLGPGYAGMGSTPATFAYRGAAAIGPPGTLPGLGWAPELLYIPEAIPLPGTPRRGEPVLKLDAPCILEDGTRGACLFRAGS
jgi:hypothetical protein